MELMSDRLPNAIDRHVASRLRLRRLEAGLSQTTLADALGISFQQLQKYEGATNRISAGALYQLALRLSPCRFLLRQRGVLTYSRTMLGGLLLSKSATGTRSVIAYHAPLNVGRGYGTPTLNDMAAALHRFPKIWV